MSESELYFRKISRQLSNKWAACIQDERQLKQLVKRRVRMNTRALGMAGRYVRKVEAIPTAEGARE